MKKLPSSFILPTSSFILLCAFSLFALAPLTAPGYFVFAHDARHSVYFLQMFDQSVRDGAWFPRWAADMVFGYGYPLWLILAPLPFFAGEAFHLVGFDFVSSVKIVDGLGMFLSALTMYLFASRILGRNAALVAAIAYEYIPYHLVDLYVRASQAELVSFVFPPLIFFGFHQLAATQKTKYIPIAALAYAGLILAHISMAAIWTPVIGAYLVFLLGVIASKAKQSLNSRVETPALQRTQSGAIVASSRKTLLAMTHHPHALRFTFYSFLSITLALALSAIFLLPVLFEQRYLTTNPLIGGFFNYRKHFLSASQLLSPFWGYGYAGENGNDQFSLQLGLLPVLFAVIAIFARATARRDVRNHITFFAFLTLVLIGAMLPLSAPLWEPVAGIIGFVQFPWRLLIVTSFTLAFLCGAALDAFVVRAAQPASATAWEPSPAVLAIILLFVTANYSYTSPQSTDAIFNYDTQMEFEVKYRELLGDTIWMEPGKRPESSPLVEQYLAGQGLQKAVGLGEGARVETIRHGGQSDDVRVDAIAPTRVMILTRFFPGWTATLDGAPIAIEPYGEQGLIATRDPVPSGTHILKLRFEDTAYRQLGAIVSALALVIAVVWLRRARTT